MLTYQDFLAVGENQNDIMAFVRSAINQYKSTEEYQINVISDQYTRKRNPDSAQAVKTIYTVTGRQIMDTYSSNYKVGRAFFPLFITQQVQYLLSNGVTWNNKDTADKLGTRQAPFDSRLQDAAYKALDATLSYGFWNLDRSGHGYVEVFTSLEFVPLFDENNGALMAGIRWWQIDAQKPLRATLYQIDGYTDYIWDRRDEGGNVDADGEILHEKRPYVVRVTKTDIDDERIYTGENYPMLPIVPFWGNKLHQNEIIGLREKMFAYDMIESGFCDSVEEASYVYWAISNAPGMDEQSLAEFLARVKRVHAAVTEDNGSVATPHQIEAPTASREALLERLEKDLFKDAMAFDPEHIASGNATATQIRASYNLLDMKTNDFEYCVLDFINGILALAGIEDKPTFTRDRNVNVTEEITAVMQAASALDDEYVTKKILNLLGDGDQAEEIIQRKIADEVTRMREPEEPEEPEGGEVNGEEETGSGTS